MNPNLDNGLVGLTKISITTTILIIIITALGGVTNAPFFSVFMYLTAAFFVITSFATAYMLSKKTKLYNNLGPLHIIDIKYGVWWHLLLLGMNAGFGYWIIFTVWLISLGFAFFNWFTYINLYEKQYSKPGVIEPRMVFKRWSWAKQRDGNDILKALFVLGAAFFVLLSIHYYNETKQLRTSKVQATKIFYEQDTKIRSQALIEANELIKRGTLISEHKRAVLRLNQLAEKAIKKHRNAEMLKFNGARTALVEAQERIRDLERFQSEQNLKHDHIRVELEKELHELRNRIQLEEK